MIQTNYLFYGAFCDPEMLKFHEEHPKHFLQMAEGNIYSTKEHAEDASNEFARAHKGSMFETTIQPLTPVFILTQEEIDLVKKLTNRIDPDSVNGDEFFLIKSLRSQIEEWSSLHITDESDDEIPF